MGIKPWFLKFMTSYITKVNFLIESKIKVKMGSYRQDHLIQ